MRIFWFSLIQFVCNIILQESTWILVTMFMRIFAKMYSRILIEFLTLIMMQQDECNVNFAVHMKTFCTWILQTVCSVIPSWYLCLTRNINKGQNVQKYGLESAKFTLTATVQQPLLVYILPIPKYYPEYIMILAILPIITYYPKYIMILD